MRFRLRINHERNDRTAKGECRHVWRIRDVTSALSGATCEVCERCGALQVAETDQLSAPAVVPQPFSSSSQSEGTALESFARRWSLPVERPAALGASAPLG